MGRQDIAEYFKGLQDSIVQGLEKLDGKAVFKEDLWTREGGGGGRTRVIENGNLFEKGGVNFSEVYGILPAPLLKELKTDSPEFYATGVSIVIHPASPQVPIIHMNVRYFEAGTAKWFGGGIDLTPIYIDKRDASWFHAQLKQVCDRYHASYYEEFKKWADDYFFINHRNETRGIGGIFFDKLQEASNISLSDRFSFVKSVGNSFLPTYSEIVNRNKNLSFNDHDKNWQLIRRGRYVEFNLVYDRGTKFGLETSGRIESILMSLPLFASWPYNYQPQTPRELETLNLLVKGINWV